MLKTTFLTILLNIKNINKKGGIVNWFSIAFIVVVCFNFLLLIGMVFLEKRKPENIIAWITVLTFLPVIGFVFYVVFGSGLSVRTRRMIKKKTISERDILVNIKGIQTLAEAKLDGNIKEDQELVTLCYSYGSYPLPCNDIKIFNSGKEKIEALKRDILNVGGKIGGVIINKMPISQKEYYASYYYGQNSKGQMVRKKTHKNKVNFEARIKPELQRDSRLYNMDDNKDNDSSEKDN